MLTTREAASLLIIGFAVVILIAIPNMRRAIAPHLGSLLKAVFAPKLLFAYFIVVAMASASTGLALHVGLWDWSLLKDTIVLTGAVALPMTFWSMSAKSGGDLFWRVLRGTLGLTALLVFYLDTAPMPLVGELFFQAIATVLVMLQAVSQTKAEFLPAKKLCDFLLGVMGVFLIVWSTMSVINSPPDWAEAFRSLLFSFWLPLTLLPFFYVFGFSAVVEVVLGRFKVLQGALTVRRTLAVLVGSQLRLSIIQQLNGRYRNVAQGSGFWEGLQRMKDFRTDLKRREVEEFQRILSLKQNSGRSGLDTNGRHLDRREFDGTKKQLEALWGYQQGQFERLGNRYWDHLTNLMVDVERHGLPTEHGIVVEVAKNGQVWRAWRHTPGGAVLGTGGAERLSQFYFQGEVQPTGWPGSSPEWVDSTQEEWPPDWRMNDGTKL